MEYTTNLNLKKPDVNEYYDIEKNNENMDLIDTAVGKLNSQVGTETLTTTAQNCTSAINELNKNFNKLYQENMNTDYSDEPVIFYKKGNNKCFVINSLKNISPKHQTIFCKIPEKYRPDVRFFFDNIDTGGIVYRIQSSPDGSEIWIYYYGEITHSINVVKTFFYL